MRPSLPAADRPGTNNPPWSRRTTTAHRSGSSRRSGRSRSWGFRDVLT